MVPLLQSTPQDRGHIDEPCGRTDHDVRRLVSLNDQRVAHAPRRREEPALSPFSQTGLWLPVDRMSDEELRASVVNFSWLARMYGMPIEDVLAAVRTVREAHAYARQRQSVPYDQP